MKTEIFDYGMNGEGVSKIDGKIVLIPNALKGEIVDIDIIKDYKNYSVAKVNKIIKSSSNRTCLNCPNTNCGGCLLKHISYTEQLNFKQQLVKKTIKKIANLDVKVNSTIASENQFNYRNKASFEINNNLVGFYKLNSHDVVEVTSCNLMNKNINKVLEIFKKWLNFSQNSIKHLVVRAINNQVLVGVVTNKQLELQTLYQLLKDAFSAVGLYQIVNKRKDSVVLAGEVKHIAGIKCIKLKNFGINYNIDIMSFHQTNEDIQNKIYNKVLSYIQSTNIITNAYSGAGLLSAILTSKAKTVYGIELCKPAHLIAEQLKRTNNLKNLININQDFNKYLSSPKFCDILILDPPKKGCGKEIEKVDTDSIIYISCNPISLAKDLLILSKKYIIEDITPFDMFPNTVSVETVVKLRRKNDT